MTDFQKRKTEHVKHPPAEQKKLDPDEAIRQWTRFAQYCRDGYPWEVEDYLTDVAIRSAVEKVLTESTEDQLTLTYRNSLSKIDASLRGLFTREAFPRTPAQEWWIRCVPEYASRPFCGEFEEIYRIKIRAESLFDADLEAMTSKMESGLLAQEVYAAAKSETWYVSKEPALLFRACTLLTPLARRERRIFWSWANGTLPDSELATAFGTSGN